MADGYAGFAQIASARIPASKASKRLCLEQVGLCATEHVRCKIDKIIVVPLVVMRQWPARFLLLFVFSRR
jgi:hypothetical protein